MDAVILAGGRGNRVKTITAEFHKPLLAARDGVPLVCHAVDAALLLGVHTPVVVVAPSNAEAISGALGERRVSLVVQREPLGPGHALLVGLSVQPRPFIESDRVLVLLSDNVTTLSDVREVTSFETAVGVRLIERRDAQRYTRFESDKWVEKTAIANLDGPPLHCWVGPIVVWRRSTVRVLHDLVRSRIGDAEVPIGPYLSSMMRHCQNILVPVSSLDVGTAESYGEYRWKGESK